MGQRHYRQHGVFHITTNTKCSVPWCTQDGVPEVLIDNLFMTRNIHNAQVYAFCILPDHMHCLLMPGESGLSAFMHSFKRNSSKDIRTMVSSGSLGKRTQAAVNTSRSRDSVIPASTEIEFTGWQNGFHDERIRSSEQRSNAYTYIEHNAFNHNLVVEPEEWAWSSMHFPDRIDDTDVWFDSPFDPF